MPTILIDGLGFGESPRWHEDRLWFSDMRTNELSAVDAHGMREVIAVIPAMPMGTGWLPDGQMLVVSSRDGVLLRREPAGSLHAHASLAVLDGHPWSDMAVDGRGNAYIGCIGFDFPAGEPTPGILALVTPDGKVQQVADGLMFPNGVAVTPDNQTLIVAESYASRLTAWDIAADGTLSGHRTWAKLDSAAPDGICLDAEGAVWYADVPNRHCVRVAEGGTVLETVELDRGCFACVLGGPDRQTLYITAAEFTGPASMAPAAPRTGQIVTCPAPAPAVGWP